MTTGNEGLDQFDAANNYLFVFMIVGLITLFPLAILTAVITLKANMPRICRFICLCATLTLGSAVAAMLLLYFALGPQDIHLAKGDQLLHGHFGDGYLMGAHRVRSWACESLTIYANRLGVMMWAISVSPNLGPMENYSVTMQNWSVPAQVRFRLNRGDAFEVRNQTGPVLVVILKGMKAYEKWDKSGVYQPGFEKCCAWNIFEPDNSELQVQTADADDIYTVIIRKQGYPENPRALGSPNETLFTGAVNFHRVRWTPTPCDPIVCDGTLRACRTGRTPERYIIEYALQPMSAPPYDMVHIRILCHPRHWALGLLFSLVPLLIASIALAVWRYRLKQVNQMQYLGNRVDRTQSTFQDNPVNKHNEEYHCQNPAFELDLV
ncbi:hypothetical protein FBUS_11253 [Fasciolopsis buskii]|uniref:DUF5730 domain-containing protein n=1 Tax=Fasciolopsis buskii TaxID=27845 RepID=A0A8E0VI68_9TREM|nr:hypothetical protein FBUS_11253 [Fasciolopsis buski]